MISNLAEVVREIELAAASSYRDPNAGGLHLATAWHSLTASTCQPDAIFALGDRWTEVVFTIWLPAVLEMAGTIPDDEWRWSWLRRARAVLLNALDAQRFVLRAGRCSAENYDAMLAHWRPILDGLEEAIGAPYA